MTKRVRYRYAGEWRTLSDIARLSGAHRDTLARRIKRGMTLEEALVANPRKFYTFAGKSQYLSAWARDLGINQATLRERINQHRWSIERALTTPVRDERQRGVRRQNAKFIGRMRSSFREVGNENPSSLQSTA